MWRKIGSPGFPFDEALIRARSALLYDRSNHPAGQARQLAAILAHGNRAPRLAGVRAPTLVMHATEDAMVSLEEARRLAAGIPGARFVALQSQNHLLLDDEPAFARLLWEIRNFVANPRLQP